MKLQDIFYIHRFLGVIEGIAISLPNEAQSLIFDCIPVVDSILDKEVANHPTEKGGAE